MKPEDEAAGRHWACRERRETRRLAIDEISEESGGGEREGQHGDGLKEEGKGLKFH